VTIHVPPLVLAVIALTAVAAVAWLTWRAYANRGGRAEAGAERVSELLARDQDTRRRFDAALAAFSGPRSRLVALATRTTALVGEMREAHAAGLIRVAPSAGVPESDWTPPLELRRGSSRVPPVAAWQPLDRSFELIAAVLDDRDSSLLDIADALEQLATAAQQLADAFPRARSLSQLAVCTFCGKHGDQLRTIIEGPSALICDECVELCVEVLEDRLGEDWRIDSAGP